MEAPSYPFSVSLIGVLHKEKCKMYMTSVLWSDQTEIVVYRTYPDFKTMHKQLKKAFPMAHNTKHSDRILPKFRDKRVTAGSQKKGPTQSLQRLRFLQKYCNKLLTCDPQVCQSADLIQFFRPREEDLQPEFSKNCIMILPSDDEVRAEAGPVKGGGNVTQPFVTETYRCVAAYETKDTKNKPFKVVLDEKVDVLIKDQAGWWLVENENKKMAWFPAPYLGKLDDDEDDEEDDVNGSPEQGVMYTTVKSYKATKDDEITVAIGAVVEVLQKSANGWWLIRYNGKGGYIPTMYLKPYNYPHIRMTGNQPDRRFSSPNQILSPTLQLQSNQLSLSQGNLPQLRSSSPKLLPMPGQQRSHSLDISSVQLPDPPAAHTAAYVATSPTTAKCYPPPAIMVEMDGEEDQRGMSPGPDSDGSFSIYSDGSDDLNSSWTSSLSFNLSKSYHEEQLRRVSHTPLPMGGNYLSPTSITEGRLVPSVSEPNLYKGPTSPKVPPRPRAQEILTRCTTVTRKNASKDPLKPR